MNTRTGRRSTRVAERQTRVVRCAAIETTSAQPVGCTDGWTDPLQVSDTAVIQRQCMDTCCRPGALEIRCAAVPLSGRFFEQQDATCACAYRPYARPSPMCRPYIQARRFCEHSQAVNCDARRSDARTLAAPSESQCLDHWTTRLVCYVLPFA